MTYSSDPRIDELVSTMINKGNWIKLRKRKHLMIQFTLNNRSIPVPSTPSDNRSYYNFKSLVGQIERSVEVISENSNNQIKPYSIPARNNVTKLNALQILEMYDELITSKAQIDEMYIDMSHQETQLKGQEIFFAEKIKETEELYISTDDALQSANHIIDGYKETVSELIESRNIIITERNELLHNAPVKNIKVEDTSKIAKLQKRIISLDNQKDTLSKKLGKAQRLFNPSYTIAKDAVELLSEFIQFLNNQGDIINSMIEERNNFQEFCSDTDMSDEQLNSIFNKSAPIMFGITKVGKFKLIEHNEDMSDKDLKKLGSNFKFPTPLVTKLVNKLEKITNRVESLNVTN